MSPHITVPLPESEFIAGLSSDPRDPSPWLALYLDQSLPIALATKEAMLKGLSSRCRQFFLPIVRVFARTSIVLIQVVRIFIPDRFASSRLLHYLIYIGLKYFVAPEASYLILRHFHLGSEILHFIRNNSGVSEPPPLNPLKPLTLAAVKDDLFLRHDLNLYNFIIAMNRQLGAEGKILQTVERPDFSAITTDPIPFEKFPNRWLNFIDVETAIEIYTPFYQLFLTDNDFWRATNSLQLDETIGIYVSQIVGDSRYLWLINNKHPLSPLSTLRAGNRLVLHGIASESLHGLLVRMKTTPKFSAKV